MRLFDSITNSINMNLSKLRDSEANSGRSGVLQSMVSHRVRYNLETEQQHRGQGVASYRGIEIEVIRK